MAFSATRKTTLTAYGVPGQAYGAWEPKAQKVSAVSAGFAAAVRFAPQPSPPAPVFPIEIIRVPLVFRIPSISILFEPIADILVILDGNIATNGIKGVCDSIGVVSMVYTTQYMGIRWDEYADVPLPWNIVSHLLASVIYTSPVVLTPEHRDLLHHYAVLLKVPE